jgi:prophage DNA circulation protein
MSFVADGAGQPQPPADSGWGAIGSIIDPFSSDGAMSQKAMDQARQAAQGLKDSAASGGFKISENAIPDLMKALENAAQSLAVMKNNVHTVKEAPRLGSSSYAAKVSTHVQKGGGGSTRSASVIVDQFGEIINLTRDALNLARKNYADNESGNLQAFNKNV